MTFLYVNIYYLAIGDSLSLGVNAYNEEGYGYSDYLASYLKENNKLNNYSKDFAFAGFRIADLQHQLDMNQILTRQNKTLSFKNKAGDNAILIVVAGDAKIDNKKYKAEFATKAKMLNPDEVVEYIGHAIGGVCPFAIANDGVKVFLDVSMKRFSTVFPACGSSNSAIELTCDEMEKYSHCEKWVDVCKAYDDTLSE